jgi:hypothetical protein
MTGNGGTRIPAFLHFPFGVNKEVVGMHVLLTRLPFDDGILRNATLSGLDQLKTPLGHEWQAISVGIQAPFRQLGDQTDLTCVEGRSFPQIHACSVGGWLRRYFPAVPKAIKPQTSSIGVDQGKPVATYGTKSRKTTCDYRVGLPELALVKISLAKRSPKNNRKGTALILPIF